MLKVLTIILGFFVVFINGFTDSPSSIATATASGAITIKRARLICGIFNFLGTLLASIFCHSVAEFIYSLSSLRENGLKGAFSVFLTVIIFSLICLRLSLPSSESHAIISSLVGASFVSCKVLLNVKKVGYVFVFMVLSCVCAFVFSYVFGKALKLKLSYDKLQYLSCSLTSFMHGWQDGQKLLSIIAILLGISISIDTGAPVWLIFTVSLILAISSYLGSSKIIKSLGNDVVFLSHKASFVSDMGTYLSLFVFSLFGAPISTGNVKSIAIMGAGASQGERVNKKVALKLIIVSVATFPICFLIGAIIMYLLLLF